MSIQSDSVVFGFLLLLGFAGLFAEIRPAESATMAASHPVRLFDNDILLDGSKPIPLSVVPSVPSGERPSRSSLGNPTASVSLVWIGPRFGMGANSPLGEEQKENFHLYDIGTLWRLPWSWEFSPSSFWLVETRLIGSAGQLTAAGTSSFMSTIVPTVVLATRGGALAFDVGGGFAFFTNHKFGAQDFGGPMQIVATTGISLTPLPGFRTGYRLQHFSDAGIYGPTSLGADMHLLELGYVF